MNCVNFWFCIGAAAIAVAGTYILWGPSNRPKRKKKGYIPGLQNLGNSCFLNSVLQALAACPSCISWLHKVVSSANESILNKQYMLIKALLSVLQALNSSEEICSGVEVIEALRSHRWMISNEEQDAHELFHVLTTTIEEELTSGNPVLSLLEASKLKGGNCGSGDESKKSFISSVKSTPAKVASPIRGLLVSELKCNSCSTKYPARYDTFDSISLNIPTPNWGQLTLQDLLLKFISCELVQDVECDVCPKLQPLSTTDNASKFKTIFTKQLGFGKLPKCLCIHIPRTVWLKNGIPVKCYDYISFPEILIMDHFVHSHVKKKHLNTNNARLRLTGGNSSKNEEPSSMYCNLTPPQASEPLAEISVSAEESTLLDSAKEQMCPYKYVYRLKAVIVHLGDTSSGHFITYRHGSSISQNEDKWFCVSDMEVKEVSFSEVSRSCAYMIFYEKIE